MGEPDASASGYERNAAPRLDPESWLCAMSLPELRKLVPPPTKPIDIGTAAQWEKCEDVLGLRLPRDYRAFVQTYGGGLFAGLYRVYTPFASSEHTSLLTQGRRVCDYNRESQATNPKRFPHPYHPEPGGLLPWGNDENGNDYFWLTEGPPTKWVVVQDNNRGDGIRVQPYTLTGFLLAVLQRNVKPLASGYPRKEDYTFQPWEGRAKS